MGRRLRIRRMREISSSECSLGEGFGRTIVAIAQTVDELAIGTVLNGSLCDAVLICIGKNRLIILDVLCYAFHEKASFVCGLFG